MKAAFTDWSRNKVFTLSVHISIYVAVDGKNWNLFNNFILYIYYYTYRLFSQSYTNIDIYLEIFFAFPCVLCDAHNKLIRYDLTLTWIDNKSHIYFYFL